LIVTAAMSSTAPAAEVWEFRDGGWAQVKTPQPPAAPQQPTTDAELNRIDDLLAAGRHLEARKAALAWEKTHKTSPLRDRVLMQIAKAYYQYGDRTRAFFHLDELLDTYPESQLFYPALQMQYDIADAYLNGYKRRFMKMAIVGAEDDAIEMLYRIQQRSPGSPLAEKALLRTADYYFASSQFEFAGDAYGQFIRSYGRNPAVPRVRLRQAYSSLAQFRGLRYDATPLVDAKTQLQALISDYPRLAAEENLQDLVDRIDTTFARKSLVTADFYKRTNHPLGAAYTYRYIETTYPDSPEAKDAVAAYGALPETVQTQAIGDEAWHAPSTLPAAGVAR